MLPGMDIVRIDSQHYFIDRDFVRFFTMKQAYWISLDDSILTDLQDIFD